MRRRAVFLDRDDTLMHNVPYLADPTRVQIIAGVPEALALLEARGFLLLVVSNQSGVGRGRITLEQLQSVDRELLRQVGAPRISRIYHSYGVPGEGDLFRKPSPQWPYLAAQEYGLDLRGSFFVGDRMADVLCGRNAGCRTVLVRTGETSPEWGQAGRMADFSAANLGEAADWIVAVSDVASAY